jgi:hypothetical protein
MLKYVAVIISITDAKVNENLLMKITIMSVGAYISVVITADITTLANGSTEILEPFASNFKSMIIKIDSNNRNSDIF